MKLKTESIFRLGAVALIAVGIIWTAVNLLRADSFFQLLRSKQESIVKLREIKQQNDLIEASFAALAAVSNTVPPLAALASGAVTGVVAEIRDIDSQALGRGWHAKRMEIKFNEVNLNSIADFMRSAETRQPPWRLAEGIMVSSPKADGIGSATLIMETVHH
jgi:hypothetical protein